MKKVLLAILTASTFANTPASVYLENTKLSRDLKEEVIEAVKEHFPCLNNYGLREVETLVEKKVVDQGIIDLFFTTNFNAQITYRNQLQTITVSVESIRWDGSNPSVDWTDVVSVSSPDLDKCE